MTVRPTQGSKLFFVTGTQNAGLPGGGASPLAGLANPPAAAVTAEAAAKEAARKTGYTGSATTAADYASLTRLSRDPYKDADDHRSIKH